MQGILHEMCFSFRLQYSPNQRYSWRKIKFFSVKPFVCFTTRKRERERKRERLAIVWIRKNWAKKPKYLSSSSRPRLKIHLAKPAVFFSLQDSVAEIVFFCNCWSNWRNQIVQYSSIELDRTPRMRMGRHGFDFMLPSTVHCVLTVYCTLLANLTDDAIAQL